jgi:hypothetical protein
MRRSFVPLALSAAAACAGETGSGSVSPVTRDSAGVTLVENAAAVCAPDALRIDSIPSLSIGAIEGEQAELFSSIASVSVRRDGSILVAESQSDEIRVFDAEGRFLFAAGGPGEGPGEFTDLYGTWTYRGDSIVANDRWSREVEIFDPAGNPVRSFRVDVAMDHAAYNYAGDVPHVLGVWQDGSIIVETPHATPHGEIGASADYTTTLLRYAPDGGGPDTLGTFAVRAVQFATGPTGRPVPVSALFAHRTDLAIGNGVVHTDAPHAFEIRTWGPDRTLVRVARRPFERVPVQPQHVMEYEQRALANARTAQQRVAISQSLNNRLIASHFPAVSWLRVGLGGDVWARHDGGIEPASDAWSAFDAEGRWMGEATMPTGLAPQVFGSDWVLGVWRDEATGVPFVRKHALIRSAGCGS